MEKQIVEKGKKLRPVNIEPLKGNDVAPPLDKEKEYELKDICYDSKGNPHYDVGLESKFKYISSYETKEHLPDGDKIHWCHPSRFELVK